MKRWYRVGIMFRVYFPFALNVNRFFNTRHGQCFQSCMVVGCCSSMFHLPDNFQEACSSTNQPNQWLESSDRGDGSPSSRLRWLRGTVSSLQHCRLDTGAGECCPQLYSLQISFIDRHVLQRMEKHSAFNQGKISLVHRNLSGFI